jgi:hypothetical protein
MKISPISLRTALLLLAGLFVLLFTSRLIYSYQRKTTSIDNLAEIAANAFSSSVALRKNYASEKGFKEPAAPPSAQESSQKYEKTATLNARTNEFERDETGIRQTSNNFKAIIQYEQRTGNPGHRNLHLMIGVRPELFDSFYVAAQRIGAIYVNEVTKVDKTTEFRELNAKKASLEKALVNLNDLKNRGGSISDLVGLHDKILDIERQMQELGVELGNFAAENEFCTFRFSLQENAATATISLLRRLVDTLTWTFQYYLLSLFGLGMILVVAWLVMVVAAKANDLLARK